MGEVKREIIIAAIQMESIHGEIKKNQARATILIEQAARDGAELIILPELFSCGYIPNSNIWKYGEANNSNTVKWLQETSRRLGIYLGAGLIEILENDYINTFVITNPKGDIEGRAQKNNAESYCFKRGKGEHIIHSSLGKIGVGICADNHYSSFIKQIQEDNIDLLLMPHATPSPFKTSKTVTDDDIKKAEEGIKGFPSLVTSLLGVPTVFVNQIGKIATISGVLGKIINPDVFRLQGYSRIIDSDGALKAELADKEGIALAKVVLDPSCKKNNEIPDYYGWIHSGSRIVRKGLTPLDILIGSAYYKISVKRKREIKKILATSPNNM